MTRFIIILIFANSVALGQTSVTSIPYKDGKVTYFGRVNNQLLIEQISNITPTKRILLSIDPLGKTNTQEIFLGEKNYLIGASEFNSSNFFYYLNTEGKDLKVYCVNNEISAIYQTNNELIESFQDKDYRYLLWWSNKENIVKVTIIHGKNIIKEIKFNVGVEYRYLFYKTDRVKFIDHENNTLGASASIPETKIYINDDKLFVLLDNIYNGTNILELNLSKETLSFQKVNKVKSEPSGFTNSSIADGKLYRLTWNEKRGTITVFSLGNYSDPSILELDLSAISANAYLILPESSELTKGGSKITSFKPNRLAFTVIPKTDSITNFIIGSFSPIEKKGTANPLLGPIGAALMAIGSYALAKDPKYSGALEYFYVTNDSNRQSFSSENSISKSKLQKSDEYQIRTQIEKIKYVEKFVLSFDNKLFWLFRERKKDEYQIIQF